MAANSKMAETGHDSKWLLCAFFKPGKQVYSYIVSVAVNDDIYAKT